MTYNKPDAGIMLDGTKTWTPGTPSWQAGFLHLYPITMFLGVLCSFLAVCVFWKRQKYSWEILQIMVIIIVPTSIFGARLWFVLWEGGWKDFFLFSGLSIHGGVLISTICVSIYLYTKRHLVDYRIVVGMVLPNVMLGQVIGRWGNFDNHEVYGAAVDGSSLDWMGALKSHMAIDGAYRQPLFFYEFLANGCGWVFMVLLLLRKNWLKPGVTATIYLIWYGIVRLSMEPLRDPRDIMGEGTFRISVFVAALSIVAGVVLFIYLQFADVILRNFFLKKLHESNKNKFYFMMTKVFNAKDYERINPVKPRRLFGLFGYEGGKIDGKLQFWGTPTDFRKQFVFLGKVIENRQYVWLPAENDTPWTKGEIKAGKQSVASKIKKHNIKVTKPKTK